MREGDLEAFVTRSSRIVERSPSMDVRATELRIVLPFLDLLGWDVHDREVVPSREVPTDDGTVAVDYALRVDRTPVVFVVTGGADGELSPEDGRRLATAMTAAGVEWGIATNGRTFAFLTREGDEQRRVECPIDELLKERAVVAHYTRDAAVERHDRRAREVRTAVAGELADERAALVEAIQDALLGVGDADAIAGEIQVASERFVDGVVAALEAGERPVDFLEGDVSGDSAAAPGDATDDASEDGTDEDVGEGGPDDDGEESPDTEYVVRFFNGRASVGAVGHSTSGGAVAQAVEYMIEQHSLNSRLDLPWGENGGRALLNYDPVHPDGSEMDDPQQLSNGYYVERAVGPEGGQAAVEKLAENSGLRVMFRGDWA